MPVLYLDHNVVVGIAGHPRWQEAEAELVCLSDAQTKGVQIAMSAWHAYELAESGDQANVYQYCEFVERLAPVWANDPMAVKRSEIEQCLKSLSQPSVHELQPVRAFSPTLSQMWASYGAPAFEGETFTHVVSELRKDPKALEIVRRAAEQTPGAIATARVAYREGRWEESQPVVDREYFSQLLGCDGRDARVSAVIDNLKEVYRTCPMIGVEDRLTAVRMRDGFKPTRSHAADLQHALSGLPYSGTFVSDDRNLVMHCGIVVKRLNLPTRICSRLKDISAASLAR